MTQRRPFPNTWDDDRRREDYDLADESRLLDEFVRNRMDRDQGEEHKNQRPDCQSRPASRKSAPKHPPSPEHSGTVTLSDWNVHLRPDEWRTEKRAGSRRVSKAA